MTTFNKQELSAKFGLVKNVIAKTSTLNHLKMLNIRVHKDKFKLTGSNGEIQVTAIGNCVGTNSFNVCVQPSTFSVMLGAAKNDINIQHEDSILSTISAKSKFKIPTMDGEQYPLLKMDGEINEFNLKELIESVYKGSSKNPATPFMCGTCLEIKDNTINAIATDGAMMFANTNTIEHEDSQIIIPNFSAEYLASNDTDGFIVSSGSLKAVSKQNNIEVICKLIDAQYPRWRNVILKTTRLFTVNRQELLDAVSIIGKSENIDSVNIKSFGDVLTVSAKDGSGVSISSEIEFEGDEVDKSFNPQKLMSCLQSVSCEKIEIGFDDKNITSSNDNHMFLLAGMLR